MNIKQSVKPIRVALDDNDPTKGLIIFPFDRRQSLAFIEFIGECESNSVAEAETPTPILAYRTNDGKAVYSAKTMNRFFKAFATAPSRTKR